MKKLGSVEANKKVGKIEEVGPLESLYAVSCLHIFYYP